MVATARVIWLCACVRYWPDRGLVFECVTCFYMETTWLRPSTYGKKTRVSHLPALLERERRDPGSEVAIFDITRCCGSSVAHNYIRHAFKKKTERSNFKLFLLSWHDWLIKLMQKKPNLFNWYQISAAFWPPILSLIGRIIPHFLPY